MANCAQCREGIFITLIVGLVERNISRQKCLVRLFHKIGVTDSQIYLRNMWDK